MKIDFKAFLALPEAEQHAANPISVLAGTFQEIANILDEQSETIKDFDTANLTLDMMRAAALAQASSRQLGQFVAIMALKKVGSIMAGNKEPLDPEIAAALGSAVSGTGNPDEDVPEINSDVSTENPLAPKPQVGKA